MTKTDHNLSRRPWPVPQCLKVTFYLPCMHDELLQDLCIYKPSEIHLARSKQDALASIQKCFRTNEMQWDEWQQLINQRRKDGKTKMAAPVLAWITFVSLWKTTKRMWFFPLWMEKCLHAPPDWIWYEFDLSVNSSICVTNQKCDSSHGRRVPLHLPNQFDELDCMSLSFAYIQPRGFPDGYVQNSLSIHSIL